MKRALLVIAAVVLPALAAPRVRAAEDPRVEALFAAARAGDVAAVTRLLDGGLSPDAKGRYDTTALFAAADNGHLAVVDLLLSRGGDVGAKDTFYGATALVWAENHDHVEVARRLVEKGAPNPESAFELAIKRKDEALARAVLARGPLPGPERLMALSVAREAGATSIVALLEASSPRPEPDVTMSTEALSAMVGEYAGEGDGRLRVEMKGGGLAARIAMDEPWVLVPIGGNRFRVKDKAET